MLETYVIVSHVELINLTKNTKFRMRHDISKVMRKWFNQPRSKTFNVVIDSDNTLQIRGTFRFDPDDLKDASHKLDEIVFQAAEDNGISASGWISFVPAMLGPEMIPNWREVI